jgi:phosphatidylinositol-bisphosphatase
MMMSCLVCYIGNVFHHFSEQPISFPPSYKFDLNSDVYDTSELGRVPSWTDRILFRALHKDTIFGCEYDSCKTIKTSDHRPVYGIFRVTIKPCDELYGIPVEPTGYNRGLYTRALKKCKESVTSSSRCEAVDYSDVTLNDTLHPTSTPATINHTTNSSICVIL